MNNEANVQNMAEANRQIALMPNVRVFYSKTGRAKYISHLDITRCMQRSLKRAKVPVWYTQGFNPHMYMTFALPLALGYESDCEIMDLRLTETVDFAQMQAKLNEALPRDIRVQRILPQNNKPQLIAKASYTLCFTCENPTQLSEEFERFWQQEKLVVIKKTKKGSKSVDLKPEMALFEKTIAEQQVSYVMTATAGQKNFNPTLLTDLFMEQTGKENLRVSVFRHRIFMENGAEFC